MPSQCQYGHPFPELQGATLTGLCRSAASARSLGEMFMRPIDVCHQEHTMAGPDFTLVQSKALLSDGWLCTIVSMHMLDLQRGFSSEL